MNLKSLLRLELIKIIKENFRGRCLLIGSELKEIYPDAINSKFEKNFLKKYYKGNLCVDFLAKDGEEALYPRSIEIIESGGILVQIKTKESKNLYEHFESEITFNNKKEMIENLTNLINTKDLSRINQFFIRKFDNEKLNFKTLNRFFV